MNYWLTSSQIKFTIVETYGLTLQLKLLRMSLPFLQP